MGQRYRNPFQGRPHVAYKRPTTRFDGDAPGNRQYTINQTWGALKRCWKGYKIAKAEDDLDLMREYAGRIQVLQLELDLGMSSFPDLFPEDKYL